jgi:hypothetical protein
MCAAAIAADLHVHPYSTRDGTYVEEHHRTTPNSTRLDNYSKQGNLNQALTRKNCTVGAKSERGSCGPFEGLAFATKAEGWN